MSRFSVSENQQAYEPKVTCQFSCHKTSVFLQISLGYRAIFGQHSRGKSVVAHSLLIPRLDVFYEHFSPVYRHIEILESSADMSIDPVNVCIRFGDGQWSRAHAVLLGEAKLTLREISLLHKQAQRQEDVLTGTLIRSYPKLWGWQLFCAMAGCEMPSEKDFVKCGFHFEVAVLVEQVRGVAVAFLSTMNR